MLLGACPCSAAKFSGQADFVITVGQAFRTEIDFAAIRDQYDFAVKYFSARHGLAAVRIPAGMSRDAAAALLGADHRIARIEPDIAVYAAEVFPDDPRFAEQWALYNPSNRRADIKAPEAWRMSRGNGRIVIAILDSGIDYLHPDLAQNIWVNDGEIPGNGRDDDNNGYVDDVHGWDFVGGSAEPMDRYMHGTLMSGIVGAVTDNGEGMAGLMHHVSLMAVKGLGDRGIGFTSDLIAGVYYAVDNGAHIINASWGSGGYVQALYDAIAYAAQRDVIFVAAAGNWQADNDKTPFYPASYDLDNVISVAATDRHDSLAEFSHVGARSVDVAAPGVYVLSTIPGGGYLSISGTSMAAPHVTGCVGLLESYAPGLTYREYVELVIHSAEALPQLEGLCVSGGRLDVNAALRQSVSKRRDMRFALYYLSSHAFR